MQVIRDLFEGLTNQDSTGNIVPGVAERWQSNDNKTWIFTLRRDARWSDGKPVTAADFVYSWQRLVDPAQRSPLPGLRRWAVLKMPERSPAEKSRRLHWASLRLMPGI